MEWKYRRTFHLQYRNQSNDSKNQVISKLHEAFPEQWSMRPVRLAITTTYNNKNNHSKINIPKNVFLEYIYITKYLFINISFLWYLVFIYQYKNTLLSCYFFRKIMKIPEDQWADIQNMLVGMSKKVYKEMVKELDIIASQEELSQQQRASNVCNHWIFLLGTNN